MIRLCAFVLLAVGPVATGIGALALARAIDRIDSWKAVDARIVSSFADDGKRPQAHYDFWYAAGAMQYTASYASPGPSDAVKDRIARHLTGDSARIFYNPENPRQIDPNLGYNPATLFRPAAITGLGIASILTGIAMLLIVRSQASSL